MDQVGLGRGETAAGRARDEKEATKSQSLGFRVSEFRVRADKVWGVGSISQVHGNLLVQSPDKYRNSKA